MQVRLVLHGLQESIFCRDSTDGRDRVESGIRIWEQKSASLTAMPEHGVSLNLQ